METILDNNVDFNLWPILWIILMGGIFYLLFNALSKIVFPLVSSNRLRRKLYLTLPIVERMFWGFFALIAAFALIRQNQISGIITVVIVVFAGWNFIRNYLAGLIVLMGSDYRVGQRVKFKEYTGVVANLKTVNCVIELDNGEMLIVPYQNFTSNLVIKTSPSEKTINSSLSFTTNAPANATVFKDTLKKYLYNLPWVLPNFEPKVSIQAAQDHSIDIQIIVQTVSKSHQEKIEKSISNFLSNNNFG